MYQHTLPASWGKQKPWFTQSKSLENDLHKLRWEEITVSRSMREEDYTPYVKGKLPQTTTVKMETGPTACASLRESEQLSVCKGEPTSA